MLAVEGQRIVPVRLRAGHRSYLTSVIGLPLGSDCAARTTQPAPDRVPPEGITLTRRLAERLGVAPGDIMTIEVMEGRRRKLDLPVSASVDEAIGMASYMQIDALNRLTGEGAVVSAAAMYVEPSALPALVAAVQGSAGHRVGRDEGLHADVVPRQDRRPVFVSAGILTAFAVIIAVGVVYNSARIGLQERAWELASLRVLGFTRAEVARILFGEFMVEIGDGIPIGLAMSYAVVDADRPISFQ